MARSRRALVSLPSGVWQFVMSMKGKLGDNASEIIRNIVISYSTQNGDLASLKAMNDETEQRVETVIETVNKNNDMQRAELYGLLNLLSEKKIIDLSEWKKKYEQARAQIESTHLKDNGSEQLKS